MKISIENIEQQPSLEISKTVPLWKIPRTLAQCWHQIKSHMKTEGLEQVKKPYAKFINIDWQEATNANVFTQISQLLFGKQKIAVGIRVDEAKPLNGEITATNISAGDYVKAIHVGGIHNVGESYKQIVKWAENQNIKLQNTSIEIYTHAPGDVKTSEMETILLIPIKNETF